jgi:hypothetical protein
MQPEVRKRYVLDVGAAISAGCDIPIGGVFRGEYVEILRTDGDKLVVRMTQNHLLADKEFVVPRECVTELTVGVG